MLESWKKETPDMNARLIAIAGPLEGTVRTLTEEQVAMGRESSNALCIDDPSVSRRHCLIKKEGEQFKIRDLDSRNGTFVNTVPITERILGHGDRIKIGDSLFLFFLHEAETARTLNPVQLAEEGQAPKTTVRLRQADAIYLQPEKVLAELPPSARRARDLNTLLKISAAINSIRNLEALERALLQSLFEVIPAERGAILLVGRSLEEFTSVFGWDRLSGADRPVHVSRTVVQQTLQDGVAILSNDLPDSELSRATQSLNASEIRSLLSVPLMLFDKPLGIIYLDIQDPTVRFDDGHLQLLTAVANMAAVAIENIRYIAWLEEENQRLQTEINLEHNMVGESPRMREIYQFIGKIAPTDSTVLLRGESGTGKELVARAIHQNSPRAGKPFMAINCAALTETLLESELFGYERGAFTGAMSQTRGKLEAADGGTVFLDEIGELAPKLQAKLLRVLQAREFQRIGGTHSISVDIRWIAATNKDLEEAVRAGSFRQDLYYRFNVVSITMPPLRERRVDIPLLTNYFIAEYSKKCKRRVMGVSAPARARLINYDWPGNVRELENAVERAVVLGSTNLILPEDLPEAVLEKEAPNDVPGIGYYEAIKKAKKQLILEAIEQAGGDYSIAAKRLGVHPNNLYRLIRNLNLRTQLKN
jgi:Nif-specific regulatory protein